MCFGIKIPSNKEIILSEVKNKAPEALTVKQAAERLKENHQMVRSLIRRGVLKATKTATHQLRVAIESIKDYEAKKAALEKESKKYKDYLTLEEAAQIQGTSSTNLYSAIKRGTLLAYTDPLTKKHRVSKEEIQRFMKAKTSTAHRIFKGEMVFDKSKGEYSLHEITEMLGLDYMDIYYEINSPTCNIKYTQKGKYKVFHIDDIKAYEKLVKAKRDA
jgi:hypothetical protein